MSNANFQFRRQDYTDFRKGSYVLSARLPKSWIALVESNLGNGAHAHRAIHLMSAIHNLFLRNGLSSSVDISYEYTLKVLNGNDRYTRLFSNYMVKDWKLFIPQPNKDGTRYKKGQCIKYKIGKPFIDNDYETIYYEMRRPDEQKSIDVFESLPYLEREVWRNCSYLSLNGDKESVQAEVELIKEDVERKIRSRCVINDKQQIIYESNDGKRVFKPSDFLTKAEIKECVGDHDMILDKFIEWKVQNKLVGIKSTIRKVDDILYHDSPKRDNKSRRLYNLLTNTDSTVLPFLLLCEEEIVEIDMRNSQLTLLAMAVNESRIEDNVHVPSIVNTILHYIENDIIIQEEFPTVLGAAGNINKTDTLYLYRNSLDWITLDDHTKELLRACEEGELYEVIGKYVYDKDELTKEERDKIKVQTLQIMYGHYDYSDNTEEQIRFNQIFKSFREIIVRVKQYLQTLIRNKDERLMKLGLGRDALSKAGKKLAYSKLGSNLLSILLSRLESKIFIDVILVELYEQGLVVIPKHDSFLVPISQAEKATSIVSQGFDYYLGQDKYVLRSKVLN